MKEKIRHMSAIVLAFIMILSAVETTVPTTVQAKSKTTTVNKSITLTTSNTIKTKYTIKSVTSNKRSILSVKKISSKKFKVTSQYKYGSAVITVKFKNGKTAKYKYTVGTYSLKKGKTKSIATKYAIKSVKSDKTKIALVKKTSSKKFKVTAKKAGTAKITVKFKNGKKAVYSFKVTGSSGGGNNNTNNDNENNNTNNNEEKVSLNKTSLNINEGDTAALTVSIPSSYTNQAAIFWSSDNTSVATVSFSMNQKEMNKGTVKAVGKGTATITALCMLHNKEVKVSCKVTVKESTKSASTSGFSVTSWTNKSTFKNEGCFSRNSDGTNTYSTYFYCDGSEYWINHNITFEVKDVTPAAYAKMFSDMGIQYQAPALKIDSAASDLREWNEKEGSKNWLPITIQEPFTNAGPGKRDTRAISGKHLIVNAGMSTRAVKLVAKQGNKVLDYIYLTSNGSGTGGSSSKQDEDLYRAVLNKIEKSLWKSGMTNLEKLEALKTYINNTNHYPNSDTTRKEYNPTFWKDWSIDDKFLMTTDATLIDIMIFQGGICDCTIAGTFMTIAMDDLGITKLKDATEGGEGVWLGSGVNSSTPVNPNHVTMWYKDPEGDIYGFDFQGMDYEHSDEKVTCEAHGCREKLISLK